MPKVWDSSTVMTPSLPTLSMASAIISPISVSAAEMDGDLGDLRLGLGLLGDARGCESTAVSTAGLDALLERHRVGAGGDVAQALVDHGPGEHGGGGGAVTGDVVGLLGDFLDQLGADLLERVLEVDLLGDRDAVVGDRGGAPLLVEHDVAALRAEGDPHGVGQLVHAGLEGPAGLLVEGDQLGHVVVSSVGSARRPCGVPIEHPTGRALRTSSASTLAARVLTANRPSAWRSRRAGRPPGSAAGRRRAAGPAGVSRRRRRGRSRGSGRRPPGWRGRRGSGRPRRPGRRSRTGAGCPASSKSRSAKPGWAASRALRTSPTVDPSTSTSPAPPVRVRSWVGMRTVTLIGRAPRLVGSASVRRGPRRRRRPPGSGRWSRSGPTGAGEGLDRLQAVPGDVGHHPLVGPDDARGGQLGQGGDGHAAGRLGEDALGPGQQAGCRR